MNRARRQRSITRRGVGLGLLVAFLVTVATPSASAQVPQGPSTGVGGEVWTGATASTQAPAVQQYVTQVYSDLFHRSVDSTGLATWTTALTTGTPRVEVANSITGSDEYRSGLIRGAYQRYLGREPEPAGLAFWLAEMTTGRTITAMEAGFLASDEYYLRSGNSDSGWVSALYRAVLDRSAAPEEVGFWVARSHLVGRSSVAQGFLLSDEHLTTVVDGYYVQLLGRHIDLTGRATWVGLLQNGVRLEAIIGSIIASDEYWGRATSGPAVTPPSPPSPPTPAVTAASSIVRAGAPLTVSGSGFKPGSTTHLVLHSDPVDLGEVTVSATGTFTASVTIPGDVPDGLHTIEADGEDASGAPTAPSAPVRIDSTAPTVEWVTVSAPTAAPGDVLTFQAHVLDATSVVRVDLQVPSNGDYFCDVSAQLVSGTAADGIWSVACTIAALAVSGDYTVTPYVQDIAGNWLNSNGGPTTTIRGAFTVVDGSEAVTPVVEAITVTPSALAPGDDFVISGHVTTAVGMQYVHLQSALDGASTVWAFCPAGATLTEGTPTDGTWSVHCTVPDKVLSGTYTVTPSGLDRSGVQFYGDVASTTRGHYTVTGGYDSAPLPVVTSIDVTPDAAGVGQTLTIRAHVTSEVGVEYVELQSQADGLSGNDGFCPAFASLAEGTATDGYWTLTCVVPNTVAAAAYTVVPYIRDVLGQWQNSSTTRGHFTVV